MRKATTCITLLLVALCLPLVGMAKDAPVKAPPVKATVDRTELPIKATSLCAIVAETPTP